MTTGIEFADRLRDPDTEAQSRMHWHRDAGKPRASDGVAIESIDGDIQAGRLIPRRLEKSQRLSEAERLVSQLITRDQENGAAALEG